MKIKNIVKYGLLILLFCLFCIFIYQSYTVKDYHLSVSKRNITDLYYQIQEKQKKTDFMAYLVIPKLNIAQPLYAFDDHRNDVEKEVMVLETSNFSNGNIALAAHSGDGYNAYFNPLDQLDETISIYILYKEYIYTYYLIGSEEITKTGYVSIKTYSYPTIKLITCKKNDSKKQIVYTAKLSKKEKIIPR